MNTTKKVIIVVVSLLAAIGIGTGAYVILSAPTEEGYVPNETFRPAYNAMKEQANKPQPTYDIEKTVRILNGMELAQTQSEDFTSFLQYMAKQDYDGVAPEVIEAKTKLFPILQNLYELQEEYDNLNFWKGLITQAGNQFCAQALTATTLDEGDDQANGIDINPAILAIDPTVGLTMGLIDGLTSGGKYAFKKYQEEQKLKREVKKKIKKVELDYIAYLEEFTPIYIKYMKEWDALCLKKDKIYMSIYKGMPSEAYATSSEILNQYPNNREAMLLNSMALIQMHNRKMSDQPLHISISQEIDSISQHYLAEAEIGLNKYIDLYPAYSAPALLLQGQIDMIRGNRAHAFLHFDQASLEFSRQAAHLTDMLDSYRVRTYLSNSAEGAELLHMYESTMEGFGPFSPNLIKAMYYEQESNFDSSREEIFKHFFRRSNQGVYDCLTMDMDYCEQNLFASFKQLLPENSYIDVSVRKARTLMGVKKNDDKLDITVSNRSDRDLQNLRIFLCVHFTDMYTSEYHIIKVPTINRIPVYDEVEVEGVEWKYQHKSFDDITRIRAIAMTDNSICWIDNVFNAEDGVDYNEEHQQLESRIQPHKAMSIDAYLKSISKDKSSIVAAISKESHLTVKRDTKIFKSKQTLIVDIPRIVAFLNPSFFLDETIQPTAHYIKGSYVHVEFEVPQEDKEYQLIMNSDYIRTVISLQVQGNNLTIKDIHSEV